MTDFERMYASLAQEVDTVMLTAPNAVRHRADRRTRIRVATTAAVAAVLVAGTAVGAQAVLNSDGPPLPGPAKSQSPSPSPSPSASPATTPSASPESRSTPTSPPTATPPSAPATIPDRAFLQSADLNAERDVDPSAEQPDKPLPSLCGAKYSSDSSIRARRKVHLLYWERRSPGSVPDGSFDQTITTYRADGGDQFMRQVRAAVTACPRETRDGTTYRNRLLSGSTHGDESILIEIRYPARDYVTNQPLGRDEVRLISVVRVGGVVTVLWELGYESTSAKRTVVDAFAGKATTRLRSWLN